MKNDTILVGVVALVAGVIIGWMVGQSGSTPAAVPMTQQVPAPMGAPAPAVNAQQKIDQIKAMVAADPKNRQAWISLGNEFFDADRPMESIEAYQKALDMNGNDPNVLTDQGVMFRRMGQYDRAIANFNKASQVDPKHATSLYNLGVVYRYDLQDFPKATEAWTKFLQLSPPNAPGVDRVRQDIEFMKTHPPTAK